MFQGSGFSLDIPDGSVDASAYCFAFPQAGSFSPNITIQFQRLPADQAASPPDLGEEISKLHRSLQVAVEDFRVLSQASFQSPKGPYSYSVSEWGPADNRIRQMHVVLFGVEGKPTLYTLTATDLAENYARSEPLFRQIVGSFSPNAAQAF